MELATPVSRYNSQNSKKRVFPGGSSSCMDADVVEIPPPADWKGKSKSLNKQKEVLFPEIIDVDMDEDSVDVMVIDEKVAKGCKGKGPMKISDGTKEELLSDAQSKITSTGFDDYGSDFFYGEEKYYDDMMFDDDYAFLQSHFDHLDIPTGIEAPIPWFMSPKSSSIPIPGSSSSNSFKPFNHFTEPQLPSPGFRSSSFLHEFKKTKFIPHSIPASSSSSSTLGQTNLNWPPAESQKMKTTTGFSLSKHAEPGDSLSWHKPPKSFRSHSRLHKKPSAVDASYNYSSSKDPTIGAPHTTANTSKQVIKHKLSTESGQSKFGYNFAINGFLPPGSANFPANKAAHNPWLAEALVETKGFTSTSSSKVVYGNPDEIMAKFLLFKKFDTVQEFSDHHYYKKGPSGGQPSRGWMKKIQDEWRMLEKNLPDSIYVRVCESRMDLLRAVIVGAEGTPYQDGLYFFDVFFPASYPNSPPQVYYHSGGLRINPNLYNNGKVCLSLLGTWSGSQKENWIPGLSTTLQVLVSIQGLILNAKPYFNEPGYANMSGSVAGEQSSLQYNERTFILSMKTMVYSVKRPPKHFEDFVAGHFYSRARDVLLACQAYVEGVQVGCLVKGGVQDVDEDGKSCSQEFRCQLAKFIKVLVDAFKLLGAKDLDEFLSLVQKADSLTQPPPTPLSGSLTSPPPPSNYYNQFPQLYQ